MAYDLTNTLVIGISSTALFNMQESDNLFKEFCSSNPEKAIEQYRDYKKQILNLTTLAKTLSEK